MSENFKHASLNINGQILNMYFEPRLELEVDIEAPTPFSDLLLEISALQHGHQLLVELYIESLATNDNSLRQSLLDNIELICHETRKHTGSNRSNYDPTEILLQDVPERYRLEYRPEISRRDKVMGLIYQIGREVIEKLIPNMP